MHMPKEMDGIIIETIPFSHGIMAHDDVCLDAEVIKSPLDYAFVYASESGLSQEAIVVMIAGNDVYLAIQLFDDVCISTPIIAMEAEVTEMPDLIIGMHDLVPYLY